MNPMLSQRRELNMRKGTAVAQPTVKAAQALTGAKDHIAHVVRRREPLAVLRLVPGRPRLEVVVYL
jgi:hypothetical protein